MRVILDWLRHRRRDLVACWYVLRDARTPGRVRMLIITALAYTVSPLDLMSDVVPVLGYLDDAVLTPLALALSLRFAPKQVVSEARLRAQALSGTKVLVAAVLFALLWIAAIAAFAYWLVNRL